MRRTSDEEIQAVLKLDGPKRFRHFIKRAVDDETVWGLWFDGWLTVSPAELRAAIEEELERY